MEPTFWVIQLLLLSPLALLAIDLGGEGYIAPQATPPSARGLDLQSVDSTLGLSQFSPEERVRLMRLRELVRATRGSPTRGSPRVAASGSRLHRANTPLARYWLPATAAALIGSGLLGIVHTSAAMDDLQRTSLTAAAPVSVADRLLPGLIGHPNSYLAAINGGGSAQRGSTSDGLHAAALIDLKGTMDRSEAALACGVGLLLLAVGAASGAADRSSAVAVPASTGLDRVGPSGNTSLAADLAPFLLVAAFLCATLSFFELP